MKDKVKDKVKVKSKVKINKKKMIKLIESFWLNVGAYTKVTIWIGNKKTMWLDEEKLKFEFGKLLNQLDELFK